MTAQFQPSDLELDFQARRFLLDYMPTIYKKLKKSGELNETVKLIVGKAKSYAQDFKRSGEYGEEPWDRAILLVIMELESD